jgi:hypothetical protein
VTRSGRLESQPCAMKQMHHNLSEITVPASALKTNDPEFSSLEIPVKLVVE